MLDFRVYTFLELCKTLNYTKTAENLFITQPAVTQHIKYLEEFYNCKLFNYSNRVLTLTEQGNYLFKYFLTMNSDEIKIKEDVLEINSAEKNLHFGATLTIGEYIIPDMLLKLAKLYPNINVKVIIKDTKELLKELQNGNIEFALVEGFFEKTEYESIIYSKENFIGNVKVIIKDTKELLKELQNGNIEFALVEGFFEKTEYESIIYSKENFIGVCSPKNNLAKKNIGFEDLLNERIILREEGSGSRDIFEKILYDNNLSLKNFDKKYELANIKAIKELVKEDRGITFIYERAVKKELENKELVRIGLKNFKAKREFNFIFMKNSIHRDEYKKWFEILK